MLTPLLLVLSALAQEAPEASEPPDPPVEETEPAPAPRLPPWQRTGFGWAAIPAVNYNTDEGFGFGAVGTLYRYNGHSQPYQLAVTGMFFMTTKGVHSHRIDVDWLDVADVPLRLQFRVQLDASNTANYCGTGWEVTCDPKLAEQAAADAGLAPETEEYEDFVRHFYLMRYIRPNGYAIARYTVRRGKPDVELFGGWRGEMFINGFWKEEGPYPGSYQDEQGDAEDGFLSVLQVGASVDSRDNEPAPRRGYWHEASVRYAPGWLGSEWEYFGFNTTLRFYAPLVKDGKLTLASRTAFDGMVGDTNARDRATMGGLKAYSFGGGDSAGRGIRLRRYVGRVKALQQLELRWAFLRFHIKRLPIELTALAFSDIVVAAAEWEDIGPAFAHPRFGEGIGLRIAVDDNFVIRADFALSDREGWFDEVGIYIDIDHLF